MNRVEEIEARIAELTPGEVRELVRWLAEYDAALWDRQIEEDARTGRLDKLWDEAKNDLAEGEVRPLDELLDDS